MDVFISHKSEHKPWVQWLGRVLQAQGRSVFLDLWNLVPGDSWVEGLRRGLDQCRSAILVATPEVVHSGWVREEYHALLRRRQSDDSFRLVPVVFGDLPNLPFLAELQAVDCRDPQQYQRWLHLILSGLDGRIPGSDLRPLVPVGPPPPLALGGPAPVAPSEQRFVDSVMARVARPNQPPVALTSRGSRYPGPVIRAVLDRAQGAGMHALHLTPPFSRTADLAEWFGELGRQAGLGAPTPDALMFRAALERALPAGRRVLLLISGFENANAEYRAELASVLREMHENRVANLSVVLLGGYRLMEQKYARGDLSLLSHADEHSWPDPQLSDVRTWQAADFPGAQVDDDQLRELLAVTGGHAGALRHCLAQREREPETWDCEAWCFACPELWKAWYGLARDDRDVLRAALDRERFGPDLSWPPDPTARRLYWADLLAPRGGLLTWRSPTVRRIGREALA